MKSSRAGTSVKYILIDRLISWQGVVTVPSGVLSRRRKDLPFSTIFRYYYLGRSARRGLGTCNNTYRVYDQTYTNRRYEKHRLYYYVPILYKEQD